MGKKQHQKDKLYITCTEWSTLYGGKKAAAAAKAGRSEFKRLPFSCCSLSLQPFEHPLCTPEGVVFDLLSIVPYLKKYGHSPVTGEKMEAKDLIKLHFHKNNDGDYHCPVTLRVFNENSHIVAIRISGNVYSYEAVERLNLKTKLLKDLITDEPFKKTDIIAIQDPTNLQKFDISVFYHVKNNLSVTQEEIQKAMKNPTYHLRTINAEARAALEGFYQEYKAPEKKDETKEKATSRNAAHYSTGAVAQSFTSTVSEVATQNEAAILDRDVVRYKRVKKKGYVRLHTNLGDLNLELHCELVPKTCENFLLLCQRNYYDNTKFHRSIKHFMIQGGDPTGTGRGGESAWNKEFNDEFKPNLSHSGRGILSMANSGPNTNGSQFFITFRSCAHLDKKHTIFGRLVGGLEVLTKMERVPTNDDDVPQDDIVITGTMSFVNPFEEVDKELKEEEDKELQAQLEPIKEEPSDRPTKTYCKGIGKYIQPLTKATPTSSHTKATPTSSHTKATPTSSQSSSMIAGTKRPLVHDTPLDGAGPSKKPILSKKTKSLGKFNDFSSW